MVDDFLEIKPEDVNEWDRRSIAQETYLKMKDFNSVLPALLETRAEVLISYDGEAGHFNDGIPSVEDLAEAVVLVRVLIPEFSGHTFVEVNSTNEVTIRK